MLTMAKRKPTGRSRETGRTDVWTNEIDAKLAAAAEAFIGTHIPKIKRRSFVEWAIEEFLTKRGAWPPPK